MKKLAIKEMKTVIGGGPYRPFWQCTTYYGQIVNLCYTDDPTYICGYSQCYSAGLCRQGPDTCVNPNY